MKNKLKMKFLWQSFLLCYLLNEKVLGATFAEREDIQRVDVTEGETLSLTCKAKPTLLRSYRWVYMREGVRKPRVLSSGRRLVVGEPRLSIDAQPGDGFVNLVLKIQEIRPYEAGLFMCWRQGLKPDPQVYVRVIADGAEEAEPISVEISAPSHVKYGGTVTIKCLITPSWPGKVFWNKNGKSISSSDRLHSQKAIEDENGELIASLEISSIRESANYTCQVPSSPPTEASIYLNVKVAKIESLTTEPHKDAVEYGESFTISCIASDAESEILWLKDGANLRGQSDVTGALNVLEKTDNGKVKSELQFENFTRRNNGQYVCYVPGDSKSVVINIEGRPPRIIGVKGWDYIVGDALHLICSTQYNKNKKDVSWLFDGQPLRADWFGEEVCREDMNNITHHDLRLPIPTSKHTGTYTCTSPFGSASTFVREIVPPYLEVTPDEVTGLYESESVTLPCSVVGYPIPIVIWEKFIDGEWKSVEDVISEPSREVEGFEVKKDAVTEKRIQGTEKVGEKAYLFLKNVSNYHGGRYRCRGTNEQQEAITEAQVVIKGPLPEILNVTSSSTVEGQDLIITCIVKNFLEPVQFLRGFKLLGQGDDPRQVAHMLIDSANEEEPLDSGVGIYSYALVISNAELEDSGTYECLAGSDLSSTVEAIIQEAPPTLVEVAASPAVEGSEFFVSCTIRNLYTDDNEVAFFFDGKNLKDANDSRYSIHLAELKGEFVVNARPRAKQATFVLKVGRSIPEDSGQYRCILGDQVIGSTLVSVEAIENIEEVHLEASPAWVGGELKLRCSVKNWDKEVSFLQNTTMLLEEEDPRYYLSRKTEGNETVHSLTIFDVTLQDSGFYQCFTSPLTSADVNVTIRSLDKLKISMEQRPASSLVWQGSELVLDCDLHGFSGYMHTVELSHNGRPYLYVDTSEKGAQVNPRASFIRDNNYTDLAPQLSYRVKVREVEDRDSGLWVCRATVPEAAVVLEDTVTVYVFKPPSFVDVPEKELFVDENSFLILSCRAKGYPLPQVMWFKGTQEQPIVNETEIAVLDISSFSDADKGIYRCDAVSLNEKISFVTNLHLQKIIPTTELIQQREETDLKIVEMPEKEIFVPQNSPIDLKCVALGTSPPFVAWFKKGDEEVLASGYNYVIYTIEDFEEGDAGEYICKAMITKASETSEVTKLVLVNSTKTVATTTSEPPLSILTTSESPKAFPLPSLIPTLMAEKLIYISSPAKISIGSDLTLMCLVSPMLANFKYLIMFEDVMLTFDNVLVSKDPRKSIATSVGPIGETIVILTIKNVRESDSGEYKCTANTDPIAVHSQHVEVLSKKDFAAQTIPSKILPTVFQDQRTESSVSVEAGDFWDTTSPFIFLSQSSTAIPLITTATTESAEETSTEIPFDDRVHHKDVKGPSSNEFEKQVIAGQKVSFTCTSYIENPDVDAKYFWYFETPERLLFADSDRLSPDERFKVEKSNVLDEFVSTLTIAKAKTTDAGLYGCSLGLSQNFTYEHRLKVIEGNASDFEVPLVGAAEGDKEETDDDEGDYLSKSEEEYDDAGFPILEDKELDRTSNEKAELEGISEVEIPPKKDVNTTFSFPTSIGYDISATTIYPLFSDLSIASSSVTFSSEFASISASTPIELPVTPSTDLSSATRGNLDDVTPVELDMKLSAEDEEELLKMLKTETTMDTETTSTTKLNLMAAFDESVKESSPEDNISEEIEEELDEVTEGPPTEDEEIVSLAPSMTTTYAPLPPQPKIVIVATPGEDVKSPPTAEVILPCPTEAVPEDITWKDNQHLLFLGSLDLAGVEGLALSPEGKLRLLSHSSKTKDGRTYTCLVFDYNTYEDVPVMSYTIELTSKDLTAGPEIKLTEATTTYKPPTSTYEFPGLEWQDVAVIANSDMAGESLMKVLREGGLNAQLASADICAKSDNINDWDQAQKILEECETEARSTNAVRKGQSLFVILDFTVRLPPKKLYGSTLISVHNVAMGIKSHVYGPLIPMSEDERDILVECGSPVYSPQSLGLDMADICKNSIASTILSLQEAYLSQSRKYPMV